MTDHRTEAERQVERLEADTRASGEDVAAALRKALIEALEEIAILRRSPP